MICYFLVLHTVKKFNFFFVNKYTIINMVITRFEYFAVGAKQKNN